MAAHVLGAVYKDEEGAAGVERALDKVLRGRDGSERMVMDVKRRGIDSHMDSAPQAGAPLTLTIDERMQYVAERELKAGVEAQARAQRHGDRDEPVQGRDSGAGELSDLRSQHAAEAG